GSLQVKPPLCLPCKFPVTFAPYRLPKCLLAEPGYVGECSLWLIVMGPLAYLVDGCISLWSRPAAGFIDGFRIDKQHLRIAEQREIDTGPFGIGLPGIAIL